MDKGNSMADTLIVQFFTMRRLLDRDLYDQWLKLLESHPLTMPSHEEITSRRASYMPEEARSKLKAFGSVHLYRTRAPKYYLFADQEPTTLSIWSVVLNGPLKPAHFETWWPTINNLASLLRPDYGFAHFDWRARDREEVPDFGRANSMKIADLRGRGFGNAFARTWYSSYLADLIGPSRIHLLGNATANESGATVVDLVDGPPWRATFEELNEARLKACRLLNDAGLLGDYSKAIPPAPPAWRMDPNWTIPR